jgi:murein DD-endopeptidase MepM/ murein hydrolase activator NlpD
LTDGSASSILPARDGGTTHAIQHQKHRAGRNGGRGVMGLRRSTIQISKRSFTATSALVLLVSVAFSVASPLAPAYAGDGSSNLSLPFATGQTWNVLPSLSGSGLHTSGFAGSTKQLSSLDFAGGDGQVLAAGDGTVRFIPCGKKGGHLLMIDHANRWHTSYYHLINEKVKDGGPVKRGQPLGEIGTATPCGGSAKGPHVHFTLWHYTGSFSFASGANLDASLSEVDLGGWTISYDSSVPKTCFTRISDQLVRCVARKKGTALYNDGTVGSGGAESPDGTSDSDTVFVYGGDPHRSPARIAVRHKDGSVNELQTLSDLDTVVRPSPSPDGSRIAYSSVKGTAQRQDGVTEHFSGIYVMNSDGSRDTQATASPVENTSTSTTFTDWMPSWCDNNTVLFWRQYDANPLQAESETPPTRLYKVDVSGNDPIATQVSRNNALSCEVPECSPDGTKIVFARTNTGTGKGELWYMNADGTEETKVPNQADASNTEPTWGSNNRLYYNSGPFNIIRSINLDGTVPLEITSDTGFEPSVSRDGKTVIYTKNSDLYSRSTTTSNGPETQLTTTDTQNEVDPAFFK